jgi:hypothetical protein
MEKLLPAAGHTAWMRFALVAFRKIISVRLPKPLWSRAIGAGARDKQLERGPEGCVGIKDQLGFIVSGFAAFSCVVGYSYRGLISD